MSVVSKMLGYAGFGKINNQQVMITGGGFGMGRTVSYLNMIHTPPFSGFAGRVQHADGVKEYSGNITFDVDNNFGSILSSLMTRAFEFPIEVSDGNVSWKMEKCFVQSLSIDGAINGLINGNLSFTSLGDKVSGGSGAFIKNVIPTGYWETGMTDVNVRDWSLKMNQDLTIVYRNEDSVEPGYIKVGLVSYDLTLTTYEEMDEETEVKIYVPGGITIKGNTNGKGFSFGGVTEIGTYSYTFESSSSDGKSDTLVIG